MKDKLQDEFMEFWDSNKNIVGLGNYSDIVTDWWIEKLNKKLEENQKEHCSEPECPECNLSAYNKGKEDVKAQILAKAREILDKEEEMYGTDKYGLSWEQLVEIVVGIT